MGHHEHSFPSHKIQLRKYTHTNTHSYMEKKWSVIHIIKHFQDYPKFKVKTLHTMANLYMILNEKIDYYQQHDYTNLGISMCCFYWWGHKNNIYMFHSSWYIHWSFIDWKIGITFICFTFLDAYLYTALFFWWKQESHWYALLFITKIKAGSQDSPEHFYSKQEALHVWSARTVMQ